MNALSAAVGGLPRLCVLRVHLDRGTKDWPVLGKEDYPLKKGLVPLWGRSQDPTASLPSSLDSSLRGLHLVLKSGR